MTFQQLNLIAPILQALNETGYTTPTPIQAQAIPHLLSGRDLLGCAQTGTGKTAAFAIPILQLLHERPAKPRKIRALILTPTRELAI
ncbi:MAG: DEAD/DEAH box helicase, partial [Saprospiraceae bacterium]